MNLHEAPSLPRGEKLPKYVNDWVKEVFPLCSNQVKIAVKNRLETGTKPEVLATNFLAEDGLLQSAIESIGERIYVLAIKNVEKKEGFDIYESKGNRRMFNPAKKEGERDGTSKISEEVKRKRFEFLSQKVLQGVGIGYEFNLATFGDALIQDVQSEDSIVKKVLEQEDTKTGKFPHPERILHQLLDKHHTQIKIENTLTVENALVLPPVYLDIYNDENGEGRFVFQLTQPYDLELETYIQDICIGADGMGYKEALVDGSMMFWSVSSLTSKPVTIAKHLRMQSSEVIPKETSYYGFSKNPDIAKIETRRRPEITISAYVNGKNVTFDQFKLFQDATMYDGGGEMTEFYKYFMDKIFPDMCKKLQDDGYVIRGFGNDLKGFLEDRKIYVVGKGNIDIDEVEQGDLMIPNGMIDVPENISEQALKVLCESGVSLNITKINKNSMLLSSLENVRGGLYSEIQDEIILPNLKAVKSLTFPSAKRVFLPKLEQVEQNLSSNENFSSVVELDVDSLKRWNGNLMLESLEKGNFDSLEEVNGIISLEMLPDAKFPSLKVCVSIENKSLDRFFYLPELTLIKNNLRTSCSEYVIPKLERVGLEKSEGSGKGEGAIEATSVKKISFPNLKFARKIIALADANITHYAGFQRSENARLDVPKLAECDYLSLVLIKYLNAKSFIINADNAEKFESLARNTNIIAKNPDVFSEVDDSIYEFSQARINIRGRAPVLFASQEDYTAKTGRVWGE